MFILCQFYEMAANSVDSDDSNSEFFFGFNPEDITIENENYVLDSDPDSDITALPVNSDEISNSGDESGESGISGEHWDLELASLQGGMSLCIP